MLAVLLSWINIFIVTFGAGIFGVKVIFRNNQWFDRDRLFQVIIVGMVISILFLEVISLFLAVNLIINVLFIVMGLALIFYGLGTQTHNREQITQTVWDNRYLIVWSIFVLTICSFVASGRILGYDEGLYYIPFMKWHQEFSIVPGLGNLYGRLAFNSNWHLFTTLFYFNQPNQFYLNETSSFFIFIWICFVGSIALNRDTEMSEQRVFGILGIFLFLPLLLPFQPFTFFSDSTILSLTACSPDVLVIGLVYYCIYLTKSHLDDLELWLLAVLPVFMITIKMSAFPCILFSVVSFWKIYRSSKKRLLIQAILVSFVLGGVWLIRNYILSGYLVYPFTGLDIFNPDWKIPIENVQTEARWITNFAKKTPLSLTIQDSSWVSQWWLAQALIIKFALTFSACSILVGGTWSWIKADYKNLTIYAIGISGILFWFLTAPDPRFGLGFIWAMPMNLLSQMGSYRFRKTNSVWPSMVFSWVLVFSMLTFAIQVLQKDKVTKRRLIFPQPLLTYSTQQNPVSVNRIQIHRPLFWDQCLDCPIPCSPYTVYGKAFKFNIEKRGSTLQEGFRQKLSQ